jgi:hypothetical protein
MNQPYPFRYRPPNNKDALVGKDGKAECLLNECGKKLTMFWIIPMTSCIGKPYQLRQFPGWKKYKCLSTFTPYNLTKNSMLDKVRIFTSFQS